MRWFSSFSSSRCISSACFLSVRSRLAPAIRSIRAIAFEFDLAPGAEPSPTAIELFDPIFHVVATIARGIERLCDPRPHELHVVWMEFALHSVFIVEEMGIRQTVKPLGIFIVNANVVGERMSPYAHV